MDHIVQLLLGILISVIGLVNISGNISTIHSYNRKRVREEDVPHYGRIVGSGTLIIGIGLIAAYVLNITNSSVSEDWALIPALILGVILIGYGQLKYNNL